MSLNCNEINLILSELNLEGSFIQEFVQPGFDTLAFRAIKDGKLSSIIICTQSQGCRINRTESRIPKNSKSLRFNQFLKSNVQGMRINRVEQIGLDRIIKMDVSTWQNQLFIYIRLWSGAANVIVTDEEGKILDCMFRRPKKGEVTGGIFKMDFRKASPEEKENADLKFPVRQWKKTDENQQEEKEGEEKSFKDFNDFIDKNYSEHESSLSRQALLVQAEKWYSVKHSHMEAALDKLLNKKKEFENADSFRHIGDILLSYSDSLSPSASFLDTKDYETGKNIHIRLDPKLSLQENAQSYYRQYKKSLSGMEALEHDIEMSKKALTGLEEEYKSMLNEKNVLKLEQLLRKDTRAKQKDTKVHSGLHYEIEGWTIMVGRNANENDDLLRHTVKGQDLWMHTRDFSGGYVFIKSRNGKSIPLEIMLYAGNLAVYHSKARKNGQADLYYCQVKYLRRAKNGPKGLVLPTHEKNILVRLDDEKLRRLDEAEKSAQSI